MFEPCVVETAATEITPMVSFKIGTVVCVVNTVPVVPVPGRISIIGIAGEFVLIDHCSGSTTILVDGLLISGILITRILVDGLLIGRVLINRLLIHRSGLIDDRRSSNNYAGVRESKPNMSFYIYL